MLSEPRLDLRLLFDTRLRICAALLAKGSKLFEHKAPRPIDFKHGFSSLAEKFEMRKNVAFVSSTVYDLTSERKELRDALETCGFIPILSESPSFHLGDGKMHSYEICLENVERSDVLIAVLGHRYGGDVTYDGETVSITLAEIKHAIKHRKVVYVFCKQNVSDERKLFSIALKSHPNKAIAFSEIKNKIISDDYRVFDNIDIITRLKSNNWISFFSDKEELISRVKHCLAGFNLDRLRESSANFTGIADMLRRGTDLDPALYESEYDENREQSAHLALALRPFYNGDTFAYPDLSSAKLLNTIKTLYDKNTRYANLKGKESAEKCLDMADRVFYAFDTQLSLNALDVWGRDKHFLSYLFFTKECARRRAEKHFRVFLFENKDFIIQNSRAIFENMVLQLAGGVVPIITTYNKIPYDIPYGLINCNALLGERILIVLLPVGFTMLLTKENARDRLAVYDESFRFIRSAADANCGALRVRPGIDFSLFLSLINNTDFESAPLF